MRAHEVKKAIFDIFQRNLWQRITPELANGILAKLGDEIDKLDGKDVERLGEKTINEENEK